MTPQELMDMDGAGKASEWCQRNHKWKFTRLEQLEAAAETLINSVEEAHSSSYALEQVLNEEDNT